MCIFKCIYRDTQTHFLLSEWNQQQPQITEYTKIIVTWKCQYHQLPEPKKTIEHCVFEEPKAIWGQTLWNTHILWNKMKHFGSHSKKKVIRIETSVSMAVNVLFPISWWEHEIQNKHQWWLWPAISDKN